MAQVLVRGLSPEVLAALKERARKRGRSLQAELKALLQEAADRESCDPLAEVQRIRAMFAGRRFSDSAELIRQDRER